MNGRLNIIISPALQDDLEAYAALRGIGVNELARHLVQEGLARRRRGRADPGDETLWDIPAFLNRALVTPEGES